MEYEWDDAKRDLNLRKHGVAFEDAVDVFEDPGQFTQPANVVAGEFRFKTTGKADRSALLTVVHTSRMAAGVEVVRLISARPAS